MEFPEARLLLFAKAPLAGRVKTRLIPHYGAVQAARLYRAMLTQTLRRVQAARLCPVELWCAPDGSHPLFGQARARYGISLHRQRGIDLGARMQHALAAALTRSAYALIIGGDCVSLTANDLRQALQQLHQGHSAVLGPAQDGGYVLLGLRHVNPALFRGIAWSTDSVLAATRRRLQQHAYTWSELPPRWDVDRPLDVRRWRALRE